MFAIGVEKRHYLPQRASVFIISSRLCTVAPWVITLFDGSCPPVLHPPAGGEWRQSGECAVPLNNLSLPSWLGMFENHQNVRGGEPQGPSGHRTLRQQSSKQRGSQLGADNDSDWWRPTLTWLRRPTADTLPTRCSTCAVLSPLVITNHGCIIRTGE